MATKIISIADFTQTSSWTVIFDAILGANKVTSGPSTATSDKTFNFDGIPDDSIIDSATLTATVGSTSYTTRTLDGTFFSGSRNVKAKVTAGGSASFEFKFKGSGSTASVGTITAGLKYSNVKITVNYTLPASGLTLNKSTCKAGDVIRGTITPTSSTASHKMRFYQDASHYYEYTLAAGTNYKDFEIPLDWQDQIPNATTDVITVRLQTYLSGVLTGEVSKTFTMTLSDDNYPSITAFALTRIPGFADEDITAYVQGFSQVQLTGTAVGLYGATISQYKYTLGTWISTAGADVTSPVLINTGVRTVTLEVTDSRGRKASQDQTFEVLPYTQPTLDAPMVRRSDALGVGAVNGTYVYICSGISLSSLGMVEGVEVNEATLKARVYQKGNSPPAWDDVSIVTLTPETPAILSGALITSSYTIDLLVTDKLSSYMYTTEIPTAMALLTGLKGISGIIGAGIGLFAERVGALTAKWPIWVNDDPVCTIRVGQPYFSKDPTSPADIWPGTFWEKLPEGTFPMAGGITYVPGEASGEGGEATHTLLKAEMPTHRHGTAARSSAGGVGAWARIAYPTNSGNESTMYTDYQGDGAAHNNLPPFRAYHIWERTA